MAGYTLGCVRGGRKSWPRRGVGLRNGPTCPVYSKLARQECQPVSAFTYIYPALSPKVNPPPHCPTTVSLSLCVVHVYLRETLFDNFQSLYSPFYRNKAQYISILSIFC